MRAMQLPLVKQLTPPPDAQAAFRALAARPHCLFLDSAMRHEALGRYSFLTADPFEYFQIPADKPDPLAELQQRIAPYRSQSIAGLPPLQGGAAGLLSYDLGRSLEEIPSPAVDEFQIPQLAIGLYDTVLAWDHAEDHAWIISHGWPESDDAARVKRARLHIKQYES